MKKILELLQSVMSKHSNSSGELVAVEDFWRICDRGENAIMAFDYSDNTGVFSPDDIYRFFQQDSIRKAIVSVGQFNFVLEKGWRNYEIMQEDVRAYAKELRTEYGWLRETSILLWSVVVAGKVAMRYELNFTIERINSEAA